MDGPAERGLRSLALLKLLLLGVLAGTLLFLNPWIALFVAGGFLVGELVRRLLPRVRGLWSRVRRWPHKGRRLAAVVIALVIVAIAPTIYFYLSEEGEGAGAQPGPAVWDLPYSAEARYTDDHFTLQEQFLVPATKAQDMGEALLGPYSTDASLARRMKVPVRNILLSGISPVDLLRVGYSARALIAAGVAPAVVRRAVRATDGRAQLVDAFALKGWSVIGKRNGSLVLRRSPRVLKRPIRIWPLHTTLGLPMPRTALGHKQFVVPEDGSTIDILASAGVINRTAPASSPEDLLNGLERHRVALGAGDEFSTGESIQIEGTSILARNPVVDRLSGVSVWTPFMLVLTVVTAIFTDELKTWIRRFLGLGRKETMSAAAAPHS